MSAVNIKKEAVKGENIRKHVQNSLIAMERDSRYSNLEVDSALKKHQFSKEDKALFTRLVYGVTERRITLDYIIAQFSNTKELDIDVRTALRMGLYQLLWMDRIPDHAAVSESVDLVSKGKSGFVNAVLRAFLRANKQYELPSPKDHYKYLSVKYSIPEDLCRIFHSSSGESDIEALLEALNREPKICLRVNTLKTTVREAAEMAGGEISKIAPHIVRVYSLTESVKKGIDDGLWFIQDEASRITSASLGAKSGDTVIDTCACPGGKSFSVALDMNNEGRVHSFDLHRNKLSLIDSGAGRLGINIIETDEVDARKPKEELIGKADKVLCDAPCSGLGVIAKKPDIRYKKLSDIERLPEIQYGILSGAAAYVKCGGTLVYSTCTLNKAENEDVVKRFLENNDSFVLDKSEYIPSGYRTFYPSTDGCDGFFAAIMKKVR